jgi:uracil-DNA glycosylase family 4
MPVSGSTHPSPDDETRRAAAAAILAYYDDLGVDEAVGPAPVDQFEAARQAAGPPAAEASRSTLALKTAATSTGARSDTRQAPLMTATAEDDEGVLARARDLAQSAGSVAELYDILKDFDGCPLKRSAQNLCLSDGNPDAAIMLIGEGPGRDEDIQGKPFVGRAGQLLDKMLAAIALDRSHVYITNTVFWRPPGNRTPTQMEMAVCRPFLNRQIELVNPDLILVLGGAAAKELFSTKDGILKLRGKWRTLSIAGREIAALPTLHPAYLLRTPAQKKLSWQDLRSLRSTIVERNLIKDYSS